MTYKIAEAERYLSWILRAGLEVTMNSNWNQIWTVVCSSKDGEILVESVDPILSVAITDAYMKVRYTKSLNRDLLS